LRENAKYTRPPPVSFTCPYATKETMNSPDPDTHALQAPARPWVDCRFDTSSPLAAGCLRLALFRYLSYDWTGLRTKGRAVPFEKKIDLDSFRRPDHEDECSWRFYAAIPKELYLSLRKVWIGEHAIYPYIVGGQFMSRADGFIEPTEDEFNHEHNEHEWT
jgi:hypothetical protein